MEVVDRIETNGLQEVLKAKKCRKAEGPDNLNSELFKYGDELLHEKLLNFFNSWWKKCEISTEWQRQKLPLSLRKKTEIAMRTIEESAYLIPLIKFTAKIIITE